ncbi:MAG: EamA family transporter [Clostridia bacterium]|nr:EamA family transporter [Clostridia bacterium]
MEQRENKKAMLGVIATMLIFGTIGIFREYTPLPSGLLSAARGLIGAAFLFVVMLVTRVKINGVAVKKNFLLLFLSGAMIGVNWILLFEAYKYTTVPIATLSYYMAPIFVILGASVVLKEKLTPLKVICALVAFIGIVLVAFGSDAGGESADGKNHLLGILLGVGAAALYAGDILINKVVDGVGAEERTLVQLATAGVVCVPYTLLAEDIGNVEFTAVSVILLIVMGVVHTGIAYTMYFGSMKQLRAQTVALLSYIDPVASVILAVWLIPGSVLTAMGWIGAVLVLGAAVVSEIPAKIK